jgi:hypothetical protein
MKTQMQAWESSISAPTAVVTASSHPTNVAPKNLDSLVALEKMKGNEAFRARDFHGAVKVRLSFDYLLC